MTMKSSRIFLSNLPLCTTEKDLRLLFKDYGFVDRIEIKKKENLVDNAQSKLIAFVTLQVDGDNAAYCVNDLNNRKLHGDYLNVSLAKESFLDRLKREREDAEHAKNNKQSTIQTFQSTSALLQQNHQNTRRTFAEDTDFDDYGTASELLISKKRAASSMLNGKIVIRNNYDVTPLHIIEKTTHKMQSGKRPDAKCVAADEKRKKSLNNMQATYKQQKSAIQQALADVDSQTSLAKKIKFDVSDEELDETIITGAKSKLNLFADDDDDGDVTALALPKYLGKRGERYAQMQSKQSVDPRFRISDKFVDEEEGDTGAQADEEQMNTDDMDNERSWQLGILQQVVGSDLHGMPQGGQSTKHAKKMLRYDPANEEHSKFLREKQKARMATESTERQTKVEPKQKQQRTENLSRIDNSIVLPKSKAMYYVVSDSLQEALKTRGDGFSLLKMFDGGADELTHRREGQLKELGNERILVNKHEKHGVGAYTLNPFSYDSSSSDDGGDMEHGDVATNNGRASQQTVNGQPVIATKTAEKSKKGTKAKAFVETFFMPRNDLRLKEGAKFFKYSKQADNAQNYEDVRNRLKLLIKTKITKSKKQLLAGGVKKRKVH